jgi:hypothetical protein
MILFIDSVIELQSASIVFMSSSVKNFSLNPIAKWLRTSKADPLE